jgi:hypothetical protein
MHTPTAAALGMLKDRAAARGWRDDAVPLEKRGVSRDWVCGFVRALQHDINVERIAAIERAEQAEDHNKAGRYGLHSGPDLPMPEIPPFYFLDCHGLVNRIIKPLTDPLKAPLYALVPDEYRGPPTTFVSHTWSSLLSGPDRQRIGMLDALDHCEDEFVWLDFVCYNQHTFEAIAADMLRVVEVIGRVSVCATPTPIFGRSWCLWELLCAHRMKAEVVLLVRPGYRNDKILAVNALYRSFKGIGNARATTPTDQVTIYRQCVAHFGSKERADAEIEQIIKERFASHWFELQDRDEALKFSASPWIAGTEGQTPAAFQPYYLPGLLEATVYGGESTVLELFADAGVYLGEEAEASAAQIKQEKAWCASGQNLQDLFQCIIRGDEAAVKRQLKLGCDPNAEMGQLSPVIMAAGNGQLGILKLLLAAGARPERGTGLSPLGLAADKGHLEVVELLLTRGVSADEPGEDGGGWTALMWAASAGHEPIVKTLLAEGASVNYVGAAKGATALHLAAQNGHTAVVRTLAAHGANVNLQENRKLTALHLAAYKGHADIVRLLLRIGADRTITSRTGETALLMARERNDQRVIHEFEQNP